MINIFWLRRDLRLEDNAALYHALKSDYPVLPIFIFDTEILGKLENRTDARVTFLHDTISELNEELATLGSSIIVKYGKPQAIWKSLLEEYDINAVFTNRDYEPYALNRDNDVEKLLEENNISFHTFKDHVIFEKDEVLKKDGLPYTVFTPYSKTWRKKLETQIEPNGTFFYFKSYPTEKYFSNFYSTDKQDIITLKAMNFERSSIEIPSKKVTQKIIKNYGEKRNFPGIKGTSRLGIHFRFGTISIREKARKADKLSKIYLSELIWRDFYSQILGHFPHVVKEPFRAKYNLVEWRYSEEDFKSWCEGKTGYPMVDAGMRELNATGFMHNRVRMITASFFTKHLLLDWRLGEAYFAEKLLDFDLASNSGGWQWAAGCGTDAAPYFRIFNPESQQKKFDKDLRYIKKWIPEYGTSRYVEPIVEHKFARERCLATYKEGLAKAT
ncbi:MAG: deoxyribodipyrimidine photo-lyase [Saprospiraceae bacterium]